MPDLRAAAAEAFAAGWVLTGAPLTETYEREALAAIGHALGHPGDPGVLEVTLKLGQLKGAWAKVYQRREKVYAHHIAAVGAAWRALIPKLGLKAKIASWWRTASILAGDQATAATIRQDATMAAVGWLHGVFGADGYPELKQALTDALIDAAAEGKTGALALAAEHHDVTSRFDMDAVHGLLRAELEDLPNNELMAAEWVQRIIGGSATDVGRLLANMAVDGATETAMAEAVLDMLGGDDEDLDAVDLFTDLAVGQAMANAQLAFYGAEDLGEVDWLTAGDDRVCALCQDNEDQGPYLPTQFPECPAHPNCRCTPSPADPIRANALDPYLSDL